MRKKFLFVIPPFLQLDELGEQNSKNKLPVLTAPYGVLSLATYMGSRLPDCDIAIIDLNFELLSHCKQKPANEFSIAHVLRDKLIDFNPDYIGISCLFNTTYAYLGTLTTTIRQRCPESIILVGGGLATNIGARLLEDFPDLNAACFGEGEIPLTDVIGAHDVQSALDSHPAWITRTSVALGISPIAMPVENLDDIPPINYSLINLDMYQGRSLDRSRTERRKEFSIHTSRGCPFRCVFCSNGKVHGKKVRKMSPGRVISDVERMIESHGIGIVLIEDDHFLADKARAKMILEHLASLGVNIEFPNGLAVYAIDEDVGLLLKKAGATTVCLAVESGSSHVLRNIIHKPHTPAMIAKATSILRHNGLLIHAFMVVGLPGEKEEHRQETLQLIREVGFDWVYFFVATPIVGSKLYEICIENNYLPTLDFSQHVMTKASIQTEDFTPEYMEKRVYMMNLEANFVNNWNLNNGRKEIALRYFQSVAKNYPQHALAHRAIELSLPESPDYDSLRAVHRINFRQIISTSDEWANYITELTNIPVLESSEMLTGSL